jgi:hypothetical protein
MKRWRRHLVTAMLLLVAGAVVNVAVAWGCAWNARSNFTFFIGLGGQCATDEDVASLFATSGYDVAGPFQTIERRHTGAQLVSVARGLLDRKTGNTLESVVFGFFGAPCPSMRYEVWWPLSGRQWVHGIQTDVHRWQHGTSVRVLPLMPIWPGFAINTLFYTTILWMLFASPFAIRRRLRMKRGLCPACAYPIGSSDLCTECGTPVRVNRLEVPR